jgi:hypothetical protein
LFYQQSQGVNEGRAAATQKVLVGSGSVIVAPKSEGWVTPEKVRRAGGEGPWSNRTPVSWHDAKPKEKKEA